MSISSFDLKYTLSEEEFVRAHRAYLRHSLLTPRTFLLVAIAVSLAIAQTRVFGESGLFPAIFLALGGLVAAFFAYAWIALPAKAFHRNPSHSQGHALRIDESGIRVSAGPSEEQVGWGEISGLIESQGFLLIARKQRIPIAVPLRAFPSGSALASFREFVRGGSGSGAGAK